jgi:hypothetical protein
MGYGSTTIIWAELLPQDYESIEQMLRHLYIEKQMSLKDIALYLGIDRAPLTRKLKSFGIPIRHRGRPKPSDTKYDFREARIDGFSIYSRDHEKRDCKNFADCLTVSAILDNYTIQCADCDGQPQMNHFLMYEYILDFEDHHDFEKPEINYREPGCPAPVQQERFGLKFLEGMLYEKGE